LDISSNPRINEKIREKEVRVIGESGEQLGIMPMAEALDLALRQQLDLVEVSPNAVPPVCKIMDYGKYRYEKEKDEKKNRKKQKTDVVKEIKLGIKIAAHDLEIKAKRIKEFLDKGFKVKVSIEARGREKTLISKGIELLDKLREEFSDSASVDKPLAANDERKFMVLTPKQK